MLLQEEAGEESRVEGEPISNQDLHHTKKMVDGLERLVGVEVAEVVVVPHKISSVTTVGNQATWPQYAISHAVNVMTLVTKPQNAL